MEINLTVHVGGQYPNSPIRHMSGNPETMRDLLAKKGFKVVESPMNAEIFLAIDHRKSELGLLEARASNKRFNILFRSEPECIIPSGYKEESLAVYDKTLTFGKPKTSPNFEFWPQFWEKSLHFKANRKEKIALINANKLNFHKTEMYSLRRRAANTLDDVDLFGMDWNISFVLKVKIFIIELRKDPLKSLFTFPFHIDRWFLNWPKIEAPQDKIKLLQEYKYALVIENSQSYMSEKLFDALQSGCIPIYVGPRVEDFGIPPELVIQSPASLAGIKAAFKKAKSLDFLQHQKNILEWLEDPETIAKHSGDQVLNRAIQEMVIGFQQFNL